MRLLARVAHLLRGLFGRERMDADLDAELASYQDELVARHRAAGLPLDEAQRKARREMGGLPLDKGA